ncbi:hypothetical protein D3C86_1003450 [compost metagenome]
MTGIRCRGYDLGRVLYGCKVRHQGKVVLFNAGSTFCGIEFGIICTKGHGTKAIGRKGLKTRHHTRYIIKLSKYNTTSTHAIHGCTVVSENKREKCPYHKGRRSGDNRCCINTIDINFKRIIISYPDRVGANDKPVTFTICAPGYGHVFRSVGHDRNILHSRHNISVASIQGHIYDRIVDIITVVFLGIARKNEVAIGIAGMLDYLRSICTGTRRLSANSGAIAQ